MEHHADIFTESQAIKYLNLGSRENMNAACERFNFSPIRPPGGEPLFHRDQLDLIAQLMFGIPIRSMPTRTGTDITDAVPECLEPMRDMLLRHGWEPDPEPCVYFLIRAGRVIYVGQSINLSNRLLKHNATGRRFEHVLYLPTPEKELNRVEREMIRQFCPEENKTVGGGEKIRRREPGL